MEYTIRNHINTYVLRQPNYIKNYKNKYDNKKEFTITPFSLKNGTLNSEKNIIAPFQA